MRPVKAANRARPVSRVKVARAVTATIAAAIVRKPSRAHRAPSVVNARNAANAVSVASALNVANAASSNRKPQMH